MLMFNVRVIPSDKLYVSEPDPAWFGNAANPTNDDSWTNSNWLKSRFHFSFAEYHNFANSNFGPLRVMNDDLVQPHRGFGTHPHANMEIITYVVEGELTHQDSMGTKETLGRGSIQFMTAGSGVYHSEYNLGDKPLRFIQTWIVPTQQELSPNYGSFRGENGEDRKNKLHHLVSSVSQTKPSTQSDEADESSPEIATRTPTVLVNQDVDAYASEMELGQKVVYELPPGRQAYLLCVEGGIKVNGKALERHDACEIHGDNTSATTVEIEATETESTENGQVAHFLMFSMKHEDGSGRTDL